jgi:SAM-dependent methyltransferase
VADLPIGLSDRLGERLSRVLDVEGKITRALDALGPVAGRDVLLLDGADGYRAEQLRELGAKVSLVEANASGFKAADASVDVVIGMWSSFRGKADAEIAAARRSLRPGGRLLVVHDYGRDDVSHLFGDRPDYGAWSRRSGPFMSAGFKLRVVHCFWTFDSMQDCEEFLTMAFADAGRTVAAGLKRPRLSYNVAIYHRSFEAANEAVPPATGGSSARAESIDAGSSAKAAG